MSHRRYPNGASRRTHLTDQSQQSGEVETKGKSQAISVLKVIIKTTKINNQMS